MIVVDCGDCCFCLGYGVDGVFIVLLRLISVRRPLPSNRGYRVQGPRRQALNFLKSPLLLLASALPQTMDVGYRVHGSSIYLGTGIQAQGVSADTTHLTGEMRTPEFVLHVPVPRSQL